MTSISNTLDGSSEAAAAMRRLADEVSDKLLLASEGLNNG